MEKIIVHNHILDEEQTQIATSLSKYSIVVAGAGSGKTLTIVGKVLYLIRQKYYKPKEFCCVSFTNEAVRSLDKKLLEVCGSSIPTYTFHKLAMEVLKKANVSFEVCSENLLSYVVDEFFYSRCFENAFLQRIVYSYFGYVFRTSYNWNKILHSPMLVQFKKMIITFISLMRSNSSLSFSSILKEHSHKFSILYLFYAIYLCYESEKQSIHAFDFDDLIVEATRVLKNQDLNLPYRFFIIDEFQDTSDIRFNFIQSLLKQNDAGLCVVGDDFQSIYHFSGCDLYLFLNFRSLYPSADFFKITNTYRNSQQLIDVAGSFVQKNPSQIKKDLRSSKSILCPIKICFFHQYHYSLLSILKKIDSNKSIFVLGRNHFNLNNYLPSVHLGNNNELAIPGFENYSIRYLTIHASKGLECDVVIVLDVEDGWFGIPSLIKDEDVLSLAKKSESYPLEEERRLFYVALTRAKEQVYLLAPKKKTSRFIQEIRKNPNVEIIYLV